MIKKQNIKPVYDLEERTFNFAEDIRVYVKMLPHTLSNTNNIEQLLRTSGSIGANYREANEALSKKDFVERLKIAREEAKESEYWLRLIFKTNNLVNTEEIEQHVDE